MATVPPDPASTQPAPPAEPPSHYYEIRGGEVRLLEKDNPHLSNIFNAWVQSTGQQGVDLTKARDFAVSQSSLGNAVLLKGNDGQFRQFQADEPVQKLIANAFNGASPSALPPKNSAETEEQQKLDADQNPLPSSQQSPQQNQAPLQQSTPPASQPDFQQLAQKIDQLQQQFLASRSQNPIIINSGAPQAGALAAAAPPNNAYLLGLMTSDLERHRQSLQRIPGQLNTTLDNAQLTVAIERLQLPLTLQELMDCKTNIQTLIFTHLKTQYDAMPPHMQAGLLGKLPNMPVALQNTLLQNLYLGALRPLLPLPELEDLLSVKQAVEAGLKQYLKEETDGILAALTQKGIPSPQSLIDLSNTLSADNDLHLRRYIEIDRDVSHGFEECLKDVTKNLNDIITTPLTENNLLSLGNNQTRAQLLRRTRTTILDPFISRLRTAIATLPQKIRPNLPANPLFTDLTTVSPTILPRFTELLDGISDKIKQLVPGWDGIPQNTLPELSRKHQQLYNALKTSLLGKIQEELRENAISDKRREQRQAMLLALGPNGTIRKLRHELHTNAADLDRLITIKAEFDKYLEKQKSWSRWIWERTTPRNVLVTLTAVSALAALGYFFYNFGVPYGYSSILGQESQAASTPAIEPTGLFETNLNFGNIIRRVKNPVKFEDIFSHARKNIHRVTKAFQTSNGLPTFQCLNPVDPVTNDPIPQSSLP